MTLSHLSEVLPRALPAPAVHAGSLRDLAEQFEAIEARENPDAVLELKELRMTAEGTLAVPGLGAFAPTDWSRRQLSFLLGIRWDRWFASTSPEEQADEINRRLGRRSMRVRLRTAQAEDDTASVGVLRALVSPTFSPVSDTMLARTLVELLEPADSRLATAQVHVTDRTVSYIVRVGEPFRAKGDSHHIVGDVWGGLLVRNSGVGYASLVVSLHLERLLCLNGMTAPLPDAICLKQIHRGVDPERLSQRLYLTTGISDLPGKLSAGVRALNEARTMPVEDPPAELGELLRSARLPMRLLPQLHAAYDREPEPTKFGVSQAATRASQQLSPEQRFELDRAAGAYLTRLN